MFPNKEKKTYIDAKISIPQLQAEVYSEPCQTSKMELFAEIADG